MGLAQKLLGLDQTFNPDTVLSASRSQHLMPGVAARFALESGTPHGDHSEMDHPGLGQGGRSGGGGSSTQLPDGLSLGHADGDAPMPVDVAHGGGAVNHVVYTVKPGDNLITISKRVYGGDPSRFMRIARANQIQDPNLLQIGQKLVIPPAVGEV